MCGHQSVNLLFYARHVDVAAVRQLRDVVIVDDGKHILVVIIKELADRAELSGITLTSDTHHQVADDAAIIYRNDFLIDHDQLLVTTYKQTTLSSPFLVN